MQLFQPGGLYRSDIELGFWSFSSTASISNPTSNYDAPYHDFVSSRNGDLTSNFRTSLNGISSAGATNYEQGFGYNNNILNTFDNMDEIIKKADIIVFMTDGRPNVPGAGDNNLQAREAGKRAVNRLKAGGPAIGEPKYIVGGIVGSTQIQASLNYVLHNGDASNSSDTFFINQDYSGLSERLKEVIGTKCDELFPPDPDEEYNLAPQVTLVSDPIVSDTRNALFSYSVNSTGTATSTEDTEWSIRRLIVDRSQPVADLYFGNDAYRDDYSCDALLELVDNNASCTDTPVVSGTRNFALGSNLLDANALAATSITIDDEWQVGTKLCYVLSLDRPTHLNNPQDRFSSAKCITIGKKPFVQIHGGDLRVGRQFANGGSGLIHCIDR